MPSGECPRNERRVRLPEDPLPRVSESSRVADMFDRAQWCHVAYLFANAALHLGTCLLLESPTLYDSSETNCTAGNVLSICLWLIVFGTRSESLGVER